MRMTEEEYQELMRNRRSSASAPSKKPKYRNYKATIKDPKTGQEITFDSQKEANRYFILLDKEKRGEIENLKRQVKIQIIPSFTDVEGNKHRETCYIADFTYLEVKYVNEGFESGVTKKKRLIYTIEDVKGGEATKTDLYRLKKKLLAYNGYIIKEV